MNWQTIPDLPLQCIFHYLSKRERLFAALTCRRWLAMLYNPQLWRTFVFSWTPCPTELHRRRYDMTMYNLYLQFTAVARHFRYILVPATNDFYALHGFLQQWRQTIENHEAFEMPIAVHAFHLTFACEVIGSQAFGTGGRLLDTLKEVLARMQALRSLVLDDLLLDVTDALNVLDEVVFVSGVSLRRLSVVSICKHPAGFYAAALFPNLQLLRLSPTQLNADVLDSLVAETQLTRLVLRQNQFTICPDADGEHPMRYRPPTEDDWRRVRRLAPWLRVRLEVGGLFGGRMGCGAVLWPSRAAPVDQVLFLHEAAAASEGLALSLEMVSVLSDFGATLTEFGNLCRAREGAGEDATASPEAQSLPAEDTFAWSELVGVCPHLRTLHMALRVPTWAVVLIAASLPCLEALHVRQQMVWAEPLPGVTARGHWRTAGDEAMEAAAHAASSPIRTQQEVAFLMQHPRWRFLSEAEFRRVGPSEDVEFVRV